MTSYRSIFTKNQLPNYVYGEGQFETNPYPGITSSGTTEVSTNLSASIRGTSGYKLRVTNNTATGNVQFPLKTFDNADKSKELSISFDYRSGTDYNPGDWTIRIFDITGAVAITPRVTSIPAPGTSITRFQTSFLTTTNSSYRVEFVPVNNTGSVTNKFIEFDNFVVGPVEPVQGAPMSEWTSFTPSLTNVTLGTGGTSNGFYRRVGDSMEIRAGFTLGTGGSTTSPIQLGIPGSVSIDGAKVNSNTESMIGSGYASDASDSSRRYLIIARRSGTVIVFEGDEDATSSGGSNPFPWAASDTFTVGAIVPIAEWAGSTVGLSNSRVEYAYNTTLTDASDTTSFGYGPGGTQFANFTASRNKRVRFQNPIQPTDMILFQFTTDSGATWFNLGSKNDIVCPFEQDDTVAYGVKLDPVAGGTDVDANFRLYRNSITTTFAGGASSYADIDNDPVYKWRIVKSSNPLSIGAGFDDIRATSLSDIVATQLGHKQYFSGTAYNGGISPTITGTNWTTVRGVFIPYAMQDGTWRLRFNFKGSLSAGAASLTVTVNGVANGPVDQAVVGVQLSDATNPTVQAYAPATGGTYFVRFTGSVTNIQFAGDIELTSKPTWAY